MLQKDTEEQEAAETEATAGQDAADETQAENPADGGTEQTDEPVAEAETDEAKIAALEKENAELK
ncbi:MAG: hypothetical protein K2H73_01150, partial [Treponemataceae bacterium]|nr:hypothetical protein [Treponemataceae bacterium]